MNKKGKSSQSESAKKNKKKVAEVAKLRLSPIVCPEGMTLREWQVALRRQAAEREVLGVSAEGGQMAAGEYLVHSAKSGGDYKVVYRGDKSEWNYCSCLDFKTSQLGTCKHLEAVKMWVENKHRRVHKEPPSYTSVYLSYSGDRQVKIRFGSDHTDELCKLAAVCFDNNSTLREDSYDAFWTFLEEARQIDPDFRCYSDAVDFVVTRQEARRRAEVLVKYDDKALDGILNATLYPYQREGIRFAFRQGRAIIADEMGLGKTIQAIGTAELMRREGLVENILVMCPTSLKYQWKREIERFVKENAEGLVTVVEGIHTQRRQQYCATSPYKIVSYNALNNDIKVIGHLDTDLVIMDEVQRLKNWDTQVARSARKVVSPYAVVLSGTPLENKLEELYSIVELVDQYILAPYYRFRSEHIVTNESGKILEYKNLNAIGERLKNVLLRRRKCDVQLQLPERSDQNIFVPMTKEQRGMHDEFQSSVARLILKWQKMHFLSETDRRRLLLLLSQMRMVCDSTYILDQRTRYDTKVDEAMNIVRNMVESGDEKMVVFSQWERMTRLIAAELDAAGIGYRYLHGGVPSKDRKSLMQDFTDLPECRVFLSTDAGSTGLNLQVASMIVNLDLPWNPAVLEQRVGRIYRIGQLRNVQVINLVSAGTIEEQMIAKLRFKAGMAEGVLDGGEDSIMSYGGKFKSMMEDLSTMNLATDALSPQEAPGSAPVPAETISNQDKEPVKTPAGKQLDMFNEEEPSCSEMAPPTAEEPSEVEDLMRQGASFLSNLTQTLQSPEATAALMDKLVHENPATGQSTLSIPVPSRQSVQDLFSALSRLLSGK